MRTIHVPAGSPRGLDQYLILSDDGQEATEVRTSADGEVLMVRLLDREQRIAARQGFNYFLKRREAYWLEG